MPRAVLAITALLVSSCTAEDSPECVAAFDAYVERVRHEREVCPNLEALVVELARIDEGRFDALRRAGLADTTALVPPTANYAPHELVNIRECNRLGRELKGAQQGPAARACERR